MTYAVVGIGLGGVNLSYAENSLDEAKHLAGKMKDNGVTNVMVLDQAGKSISTVEGLRSSKDHWRASDKRR